MSYHHPTDTEIAAIGLDGVITSLQQDIKAQLTWIEKVFHRAYYFQENDQDGRIKRMVPKCFEAGNEYVNVLPNDHVKSQLFFIPTSDEDVQDPEPNVIPIINQDVALVFWCDVRFLPGNTKTVYTPSLALVKYELMQLLNSHDAVLSISSIVDKSAEDVFDGFTIDDDKTHYTMLPFAGLRINFKVKFDYKIC